MKTAEERFNDAMLGRFVETVKWVNELFNGKVTFCGSFGLVLNGKLKRPLKDLDVITEENYYGQPGKLPDPVHETFFGLHSTNDWGNSGQYWVNGNKVYCFKIEHAVHNVVVDVLYTGLPTDYDIVDFYGIKIRVEKPDAAIVAKIQYAQSPQLEYREKHESDLKAMGIDVSEFKKKTTTGFDNDDIPY